MRINLSIVLCKQSQSFFTKATVSDMSEKKINRWTRHDWIDGDGHRGFFFRWRNQIGISYKLQPKLIRAVYARTSAAMFAQREKKNAHVDWKNGTGEVEGECMSSLYKSQRTAWHYILITRDPQYGFIQSHGSARMRRRCVIGGPGGLRFQCFSCRKTPSTSTLNRILSTDTLTAHKHTSSFIYPSEKWKRQKKNSVLYRRYKTLDKGGWEWNMMWLDTKIAAAAAAHKTESWAWHHRFSIIFVHAIWHFPSNAMVRSPKKNGDIHQGKCIKSTTHSQ